MTNIDPFNTSQIRFVANVFEHTPIICTISSLFHTGESLNSCSCEITPNPSSPRPTPAKIKLKCTHRAFRIPQ